MNNGYINGIIKVCIDVVCMLTSEKDFYQFFVQNSFKVFIQIVLPMLKISQKEIEMIAEDPKEFVNLSIDTCSKQKSKTYKTQAAKLLEHLVDHIDGILTFVVNFCLETLTSIALNQQT